MEQLSPLRASVARPTSARARTSFSKRPSAVALSVRSELLTDREQSLSGPLTRVGEAVDKNVVDIKVAGKGRALGLLRAGHALFGG